MMVQHLNETSGAHQNSTALSPFNDGTPSVTIQGIAPGQISGADVFDGVDDNIDCGNDTSLEITDSLTVEAWAYSSNGIENSKRIASKDAFGIVGKFILWKNAFGDLAFIIADSSDNWYRAQGSPVTDGTWFHVVGVFDADSQQVRLYKDGVEVASVAGPDSLNSPTTEKVIIGASDDNQQNWNGILGEIRISNGKRSAEWIQASYANQNNPTSFYLLGIGMVSTKCFLSQLNWIYSVFKPKLQAGLPATCYN